MCCVLRAECDLFAYCSFDQGDQVILCDSVIFSSPTRRMQIQAYGSKQMRKFYHQDTCNFWIRLLYHHIPTFSWYIEKGLIPVYALTYFWVDTNEA